MQPSCPDRRGLFFRSAAGLGTLDRRGCTCWKRHGHHFVQVTAVPLALLLFTAFDAGHLGSWPQSHRCIISPLIIIFLPFQPVFPLNVPLCPFGLCNLLYSNTQNRSVFVLYSPNSSQNSNLKLGWSIYFLLFSFSS